MARPLDRGDQPDLDPNPNFTSNNQSPFPSSQYPYPHGAGDYPIDQELTMANEYKYAQNIPPGMGGQLEDSGMAVSRSSQVHAMNVSTNGSSAAGMAPPQTPHQQSFASPGHRASTDDVAEGTAVGESAKRKRSKVSRACDECRRKKVKCDAAAEDGTVKTCSNCAKAGLTCEYSRVPMKRGPSKGYIKELSERVQQVESLQLAMSGQPGYRPSLDTGSNAGAYPDPAYSPEDGLSLKRNYSFSDTRNPFAQSEFHRDRMPSVGGWGVNFPLTPGFRPRDRGSVAIAPDQQLPPVTYPEYSKPFWADFEEPPPAKRQKRDEDDQVEPLRLDAERLDRYYDAIHPLFPLLPDADTVLGVLQTSSPLVQHAFTAVMDTLPASTSPTVNGENGSTDQGHPAKSPTGPDVKFGTFDALSAFLWQQAQENPAQRADDENLAYLWTYVLLALQSDSDMSRITNGSLSRTALIKQSIDLAIHLKREYPTKHEHTSMVDKDQFLQLLRRAWNAVCTLAKFHALSVGIGDFTVLDVFVVHTDDASTMPDEAAFIARASNLVAIVATMIQDGGEPQSRLNVISKNLVLRQHFAEIVGQTPNMHAAVPIVRRMRLFLELLLSRSSPLPHPVNVLQPAVDLADALISSTSASAGTSPLSFLDLHFFTLATVTLLEFFTDVPDPDMNKLAEEALGKLQPVIEQKAEWFHRDTARLAFFADNTEADRASKTVVVHWTDGLLTMIEHCRKSGSAAQKGVGDGSRLPLDFGLLVSHGYLNALLRFRK